MYPCAPALRLEVVPEGPSAAPPLRLFQLCMCPVLVPSEFPICEYGPRKNCIVALFLEFAQCQRAQKSRYRPKGVFFFCSEKASAIARMRQNCVRNASKMRQNGSCFIAKRGTFQNASEMRQNCVKNASKMRGTPWGENTFKGFWTIPKK